MTINRIAGRSARLTAVLAVAAAACLLVAHGARAAEGDLNACGCRQTGQGLCVCEKKSKCGCAGECEPKGCEERRAKQIEKEIQAETKKAEDASRRQNRTPPKKSAGDEEETTSGARGTTTARGPKMTAAQRKDLARLLASYLAEHPDEGSRTIEQVREALKAEATSHRK